MLKIEENEIKIEEKYNLLFKQIAEILSSQARGATKVLHVKQAVESCNFNIHEIVIGKD